MWFLPAAIRSGVAGSPNQGQHTDMTKPRRGATYTLVANCSIKFLTPVYSVDKLTNALSVLGDAILVSRSVMSEDDEGIMTFGDPARVTLICTTEMVSECY